MKRRKEEKKEGRKKEGRREGRKERKKKRRKEEKKEGRKHNICSSSIAKGCHRSASPITLMQQTRSRNIITANSENQILFLKVCLNEMSRS